jgi:hypothetical protein
MFLRFLLNLFAALSLLLMLAVVTLWVRSYWRRDVLAFQMRVGTLIEIHGCDSGHGAIGISWVEGSTIYPEPPHYYTFAENEAFALWPLAGKLLGLGKPWTVIWFRHWVLLPPLMIAPALWLRRWRRERGLRGRGFAVIADSPSPPMNTDEHR